jgi:uncharacterized protein YqcC (DUF446 family)
MAKKPATRTKTKTKKIRPHDPAAIFAKLDEIEAEMKKIGFWSPDSAEPENGNYQGSPLKLWLQFVFLPAAREATHKREWPDKSGVGLFALRTYDYFEKVEEALTLVSLLNDFDYLIEHPEHFVAQRKASS